MATPTEASKRLLAVGFKKAVTWGTAVALGAGYGLPVESLGGFNRVQDYISAKESDSPMVRSSMLDVIKPVDATYGVQMLYDPGMIGTMLALLMGTAGAPTQQGATAAYLHTLQLADSIFGKFGTLAAEFPSIIWEAAAVKPLEFSLKATDKGFMGAEFKLRGNTIIDNSAVNTATQMDALTYVDRVTRVLFRHNTVYMNDQTAGDATGTAAWNVNGIEIDFKRQGFDEPRGANSISILEPIEGAQPDIRLKLSFPRFDSVNAVLEDKAIADTYQKAVIVFTGPLIASSYYYFIKFFFPNLRMLVPTGTWSDIVKHGVELVAEECSAAPTGMSYTRPYIQIENKQTTDYLA
jgi:hypothetical protein